MSHVKSCISCHGRGYVYTSALTTIPPEVCRCCGGRGAYWASPAPERETAEKRDGAGAEVAAP